MQAGIGSGKRASRPLSALVLLGALALALSASLLFSSLAQAGIGQLPGSEGVFGESSGESQLEGAGSMAINRTGAGGVPKGTIYVAARASAFSGRGLRVAQYRPHQPGESGFDFALSWEIRNATGTYERCGPQAEEPSKKSCPSQPTGAKPGSIGVAVDQGSGNVFVFRTASLLPGGFAVHEYDANGKALLARFAELAPGNVTTASTPSQVHNSPYPGGIAINDAAEVFVFDSNDFDQTHRLMRFKPKTPGDLTEYEYVAGADIGATKSSFPTNPIVDVTGDIYTAGEGTIEKFDPDKPGDPPICTFSYKPGGITGMTVEPETGAPFFFSYKKPKAIHQLSPCNGSGEFVEEATITLSPERDDPYALAYDPERNLSAARPLGALYAIAAGPTPSSGVGKGEPGKTALGYILGGAQEANPVVVSQAVLGAGESTAELQASVNPRGFQTHYAFQYLSRAAYEQAGESFSGAAEAPPGGASAGNGQSPVSVSVSLSGLVPDTEYLYRAVAESHCAPEDEPEKVCHGEGEPESFATAAVGASLLPDGRAYELVSPTQKNGGQVLPADPNTKSCAAAECKPGGAYTHFPMQASPEGDAVLYEGDSFAPGEGAVIESAYLAHRGATGWTNANLTPPQLLSKGGQGYKLFNASLSEGLLEQTTPSLSPEAPVAFQNLYHQPSASPTSLDPLLRNDNSFIHRTSGIGLESLNLTFAGASADLSRVFFAANDALTSEAGEAGEATNLYEWREGALTQVNLAPGSEAPAPGAVFGSGKLLESGGSSIKVAVLTHAISADGSRVFWTGADGGTYARIDGLGTLQIPGPGSCKASLTLALRTCFLGASEDGSRVLLSNGQLYELNEEAGAYEPTVDLSDGEGGFKGILGQSEDLSRVYFVDTAVLSGEEENEQGAKAQAGKDNLYAWVGGTTSFVATLAAADNAEFGDWQAAPQVRTAEASPAGRYLAFLSQVPLSGYDNVGPCKVISGTENFEAGPCTEVFLYDSASGELSCPSCNPGNAAPHGPSTLRTIYQVEGSLPQPRYLTDAGRLYFDSQDALVPADSNGRAEDLYQYEPEGIGGCEREGGCVGMISGGSAATDSNFLAIDATGENVFFTTRERLVPADKDEQIDLYDARVGGGFPNVSGERSGEGPSTSPPAEAIPASQGFTGPGNVVASKGCAKGKVKRKGRCVRKHGHKHQRHRRATPGRANRDRGGAK